MEMEHAPLPLIHKLDARLSAAAALVRPGSRLADIGTDHARLPVRLVADGVCPCAIASDIRKGPAEAARRTIREAGLTDKIQVRLGDGLSPLRPDETEDIVIAGMGGETIIAILEAASWTKDARLRFILQPMTRAALLHRWLLAGGFAIETERAVADGPHFYPVVRVVFTGEQQMVSELEAITGGLSPQGADSLYLEKQRQSLLKKAAGLQASREGEQEADKLLRLADELADFLRKGEDNKNENFCERGRYL